MNRMKVFTDCTVLDGTKEMQPRSGMTVIVCDGKITDIGADIAPENAEVIDLKGRYLLPGLINAHVHLPGSGMPGQRSAQKPSVIKKLMANPLARLILRKMCEGYAQTELLSGTTTIRTVGGLGSIDTDIRDRVNNGKLTGPRILASNMAVSVPNGHMAGVLAYEAESPEDCRRYVRKIAEDKPDLIKLMITGGVLDATVKGEPGVLRMPPEYVKAACEEAHALGFHVAAHVESPEGVRVALEGGVDTIEHGAKPDEKIIELFKERGAADICTISPAVPLATFPHELTNSNDVTQYNGKVVMDGIIDSAKACLENGIPVGLGTDTACPFVTHYDMWREVYYFHRYVGASPSFALYTATLGNAEILGIDSETGSVENGKSADFFIADSNPLDDLRALSKPYMVVFRGNVIINPRVKKISFIEENLDKMFDK